MIFSFKTQNSIIFLYKILCNFRLKKHSRCLCFDFSARNFVCVFKYLSVFLTGDYAFADCHDIWNERAWYTGGVTYMLGFFIYIPFQYGGRVVGLFRTVMVKRLDIFSFNLDSLWTGRKEVFVLTWAFRISSICVCLSGSRLRLHVFTVCL